jgi:hypothetical protein
MNVSESSSKLSLKIISKFMYEFSIYTYELLISLLVKACSSMNVAYVLANINVYSGGARGTNRGLGPPMHDTPRHFLDKTLI